MTETLVPKATYDPSLSHFDVDYKRGAQTELWVKSLTDALQNGSGTIECKRDSYFISEHAEDRLRSCGGSLRVYVELCCRSKVHGWEPSGLSTTRATLWLFQWGCHPGGIVVSTEWLRRAVDRAVNNPENHASCSYGGNPTHGVFVSLGQLLLTRDKNLDEH